MCFSPHCGTYLSCLSWQLVSEILARNAALRDMRTSCSLPGLFRRFSHVHSIFRITYVSAIEPGIDESNPRQSRVRRSLKAPDHSWTSIELSLLIDEMHSNEQR
jgi:hypothetical protein